jgi:hypothetical protein
MDTNEMNQFAYISDENIRRCVLKAYRAVKELNYLDFILNNDPPFNRGYTWWDCEEIKQISHKLENDGHSGASFALTLRLLRTHLENIP